MLQQQSKFRRVEENGTETKKHTLSAEYSQAFVRRLHGAALTGVLVALLLTLLLEALDQTIVGTALPKNHRGFGGL